MAYQRYQGKRFRRSRRMRNSQFCLSCKRPIGRRTVVLATLIYYIFLNCLNLIWPDLANVVIFKKRLVSTYVFYLPLYGKKRSQHISRLCRSQAINDVYYDTLHVTRLYKKQLGVNMLTMRTEVAWRVVIWLISPWTKWPPFCWRCFQMHVQFLVVLF